MKTETKIYGAFNCIDTPRDKMVVSQNFDNSIDGLIFNMDINNSGIETAVILDRQKVVALHKLLGEYLNK